MEYLQNFKPSIDPKYTVVPSTSRLRVQVRAHHDWWRRVVLPWSDGKEVAHLVDRSLAVKGFGCGEEPISDLLIGVTETETGHACLGGVAV